MWLVRTVGFGWKKPLLYDECGKESKLDYGTYGKCDQYYCYHSEYPIPWKCLSALLTNFQVLLPDREQYNYDIKYIKMLVNPADFFFFAKFIDKFSGIVPAVIFGEADFFSVYGLCLQARYVYCLSAMSIHGDSSL